jgi:hypothetical protein
MTPTKDGRSRRWIVGRNDMKPISAKQPRLRFYREGLASTWIGQQPDGPSGAYYIDYDGTEAEYERLMANRK